MHSECLASDPCCARGSCGRTSSDRPCTNSGSRRRDCTFIRLGLAAFEATPHFLNSPSVRYRQYRHGRASERFLSVSSVDPDASGRIRRVVANDVWLAYQRNRTRRSTRAPMLHAVLIEVCVVHLIEVEDVEIHLAKVDPRNVHYFRGRKNSVPSYEVVPQPTPSDAYQADQHDRSQGPK